MTGLDYSGNPDVPVKLPDLPDKPSADPIIEPYGELVRSLDCPEFEIPERLRCIRLSSGGRPSSVGEGQIVPNGFDGMAAFPLPNGNVRLIRNHEMRDAAEDGVPLGEPWYDGRASGGTTSLEVRVTGTGDDPSSRLRRTSWTARTTSS